VNRHRTYDAFTVSVTRLFVAGRRTGKVFEVRGLPLEWRPFSDLLWTDNQTLHFDRWSQPHYGIHYSVNVKRKKLISAVPFSDEFYLKRQRSKTQHKSVGLKGTKAKLTIVGPESRCIGIFRSLN